MIEVEVPGQGVVEFPDDTSEDAITGALQRFSQPQIKLSPYEQARMAGPLPPMGTMGPEHPQEVLELPKLAQIPGEILNQITQPAGDILADVLNRTGLDPSAQPGQPVGGTSGPIGLFNIPGLGTGPMKWIAPEFARGAEQKAGELFNEFRTPEMLGTLPLAPESKLIQGLFAGQAVAQIPESLQAVAQARSPQELGGALTGAGANIGMAYLMGKGFAKERIPDARKNFPPAKIHGDVQPQPEQSPGQVPAQEGSGGVQPQAQTVAQVAQGVAQTAQVPLDLVADLEREAIEAGEKEGSPVKVVDSFTGEDPNAPFAGRFMRATGKGIEVKRGEFQDWIQDLVSRGIPPDQIRLAVQARINEEQIHNQTISAVGSEGAESYWNNLSAAEKLIQQRRYTGQWTRTGHYAGLSDVQMGYEAIRHRMQQLMNRTPSEIAEVAGREYWTLKSLTALEDVIRKTREALGTDASKAQLAILAKVQDNLGVAQAVIGGPAAVRRKKPSEENRWSQAWLEPSGEIKSGDTHRRLGLRILMDRGVNLESNEDYDIYDALEQRGYARLRRDPSSNTVYVDQISGGRLNEKQVAELRNYGIENAVKVMDSGRRTVYYDPSGEAESPFAVRRGKKEIESMSEYGYYSSRLANPELLDHSIPLGWVEPGLLAVPVGGKRKSGTLGCATLLSQEQAQNVAKVLEGKAGFPNPRVIRLDRAESEHGPDVYNVEWGAPVDWDTGWDTDMPAYHRRLAQSFGYRHETAPVEELTWGERQPFVKGDPQSELPFAVRRKGKGQPYDPEQMKMFGVEQMTAKGVPGSTETVQPISAQEAGALPSFTANDVDVAAVKELSKPVPSFNRFLGWVERNVGSGVRPDRQSLWQDQMWNYLLNAPGERLEQMRSALGLEKDTGTARVGSREEVGKTKRGRLVLRRAPQEYRATVISAIAQKLMGEAMPRMRDLDRSEVTMDDIDFENARADAGAYHKFSESEMTDPDKYTAILSNRARPSKHDPVSNTRRVAVLVDKRTGEVELVSAYKHGREGIEVTDPSGSTGVKNKPSRSIGGLLGRYRLHASILLRDPVRSFHQHFEKMSDYVSAIEKEAEDREKVAEFDTAEESMFERRLMMSQLYPGEELEAPEGLRAEEQGAEEEIPVRERRGRAEEIGDLREAQEPPAVGEGVEGEGGMVAGPQAGVARGAMGMGKGLTERSRYSPLTATEANAVRDFVGPIDSLEDMKAAVQELIDTGKLALERPYRSTGTKTFRELKSELPRYRFRAIHRASISAIQKVAQDIFNRAHDILPGAQKEVHVTQEQAYEAALNSIYNAIVDAKSPQDFTQRLLGQHTRPTGEALTPAWRGQPLLARAEGVSRELTMRSRVPPTTVRGPSGRPIPATAPAPEPGLGGPGRVIPPERLPEAARAHVEELAAEGKPYVPSGESFRPAKPTGRIRDYPVEFVTKTGLRGPRLEPREIPAAVRRNAKVFSGKYDTLRDKLAALVKRPATNHEIYALKDGAENQADIYSYNQSNGIRLASMAPPGPATRIKERETTAKQVRAAAKAVIAAQFEPAPGVKRINPKVFDDLEAKVTNGRGKAEAMIAHAERLLSARQATPTTRSNLKMGRAWLKAVDQLQAELDYARAHYKDPEMQAAVAAYNEVMEQHRQFLNNNGAQIAGRENFIPGRYEGEMWMDGRIGWGGNRILGTQFRMPKVFDNYYDAISVGPYLPVNPDIADLAQHSMSRGARAVNNQMWLENLKSMRDPLTKQLIAKSAVGVPVNIEVEDPATGQMVTEKSWQWKSPDPNYELVQFSRDAKPVAVRVGYSKVVGTAMAKSHIEEYPGAKAAKYASALLKHGIVLALDTFHPGRLAEYNMALGGGKWHEVTLPRYERGWSALTWEAKDLPQAVAKGLIPKEAADWALEPIKVHDRGRVLTVTRHQLLRDAVLRGFNTVRIADGLYRNAIEQVPLVGKAWNRALESANKWIFDKITPGMMAESFVRNFERLNKPGGLSYDRQMREVIRDVNIQYGNMGRQGVFKSPTVRDVLQIFMLAPMWREGLVQKEVRALSRFSGASALLGRRGMDANNYIGTLGRGLARGIGAWFVTAQIINMLSRGHPTWQNKEDGHALDAWIPAPNGKDGIWISTLGVFAEVLHDLVRLGESKPRVWDALEQMGVNTYGPVGRATRILTTGQTMTGERISSTAGILGAAAGELAPLPISATPFRSLAHAVAPGLVRPLKPGEAMQRMAALVGVKTQLATRSETDIRAKAAKFLRTEGLKVPSEYPVTTDEPSYSKLRQALRNDDSSGIKDTYAGLLKHHTPQQIEKSLKQFTSRPYTGSKANEELFLYSLSNDDLELYHKANLERAETFEKFMDWLRTQ